MTDEPKTITPRIVVQMLLFVVVQPFLPLIISWHWGWLEAWIWVIICILGYAVSRMLVARRYPDLLRERALSMRHIDAKAWDRVLASLLVFGGFLIPIMAGLDTRFGWSPDFSWPVKIVALAFILAGWALGTYALIENRFFSGLVRIQTDRDHHVISTGPYRWVRHPGYTAWIFINLATPFFLDTLWGLLPVIILSIILLIRTQLEDGTLRNELEGYRDYTSRVRYRLIPGIW